MSITKIKKRDGSISNFDESKIQKAIQKAIEAVGGKDFSKIKDLTDEIVKSIEIKFGSETQDIEYIQDTVESVLIKNGHDTVAKAYITYRLKRKEDREDKKAFVEANEVMNEYLDNLDRRINENANVGYSLGGLIIKNSEKIIANYRLSHIYPEEVNQAHREGDYHIHDLGFFGAYCAGRSLRALLEEGINGVPDKVSSFPPRHLNAAVNQIVNFLGVLQNERAGAQAFSSFDTYLAPFVHKYYTEVEQEFNELDIKFESKEKKKLKIREKTEKYVRQCLQNFLFGMNTPSRRGMQTPFSNITLDRTCPSDLKNKALLLGGIAKGPYCKTFGELQTEIDLINKVLIEVYMEGDMSGRVFTFPIPTYNITEDFDRDSANTNLLFELASKYGIPNFQNFLGSQFIRDDKGNLIRNEKAYRPGDVRSMCCRLQLDLKELKKRGGGLFGSAEMTGSIGVVTINLARIGYLCKGNKELFFERLEGLMDKAKTSLEIKRKVVQKRYEAGLYPYTRRYLPSFRSHFSTIGINGMNEAIRNFSEDKYNISDKEGIKFAVETLEFMRDRLTEYQEETGNLYNLEATPAEGTTYRFAKEDKKRFSDIIQAGTQDAPYYTNSTQLPVERTDDVFEMLDLQDDVQTKYTGGTMQHIFLGESLPNGESAKILVKKILSNYRLPYITLTPTFSVCPKHGYIKGERDYCPKCDEEMGYKGNKYDIQNRRKYTSDQAKMSQIESCGC